MAAPMMRCCLRAVSAHCPSCIFPRIGKHSAVVPAFANLLISSRPYAAKKQSSETKSKSRTGKKTSAPAPAPPKKRYQPFVPRDPTDDVYLTWLYRRPIYEAEVAVDMLKKFQQLDFTYPRQHVYADITLDMTMDTKKAVEPFAGALLLPYPFVEDFHKVLVITEKAEEAALAKENGAAIVGGFELVKPISDGEIQADFYVTVPGMIAKLNSLRSVLKDKYPKSKNGSVSYDVPKMVNFFKACHEYTVENNNLVKTRIATLDMPNDQIVANLDAVIKDVCKHKPLSYGSFVRHLKIRSSTSEGLVLKFGQFLPQEAMKEKEKVEEKAKEDDDDGEEREVQESK